MKKLLFALMIAIFIFACKAEDDNGEDIGDTTDVAIDETVVVDSDTIEIVLTEEEYEMKSDDVLKKSEELNNKIDEVLNNL